MEENDCIIAGLKVIDSAARIGYAIEQDAITDGKGKGHPHLSDRAKL
jgi:hypothetical protein